MSFLERVDTTIARSALWRSLFRQPYPTDERSRAMAVMNNVFLHIHPVRVRQHAVKFAYTFCLGGLSFFFFLVLTVTGVYLMFFYVPSATSAYDDILRIQAEVPFGLLTRNIHRWARAPDGVLRVPAHDAGLLPRRLQAAARVQLGRRRVLLFLTIVLSFTGYLLPWDQIAFWAITIGTNMATYVPLVSRPVAAAAPRRHRGRPEHAAALLRAARDPDAARRRHLPGRPLLADPQGRRHLRAAVGRRS